MAKLIKCDYDHVGNIKGVYINIDGQDVEFRPVTHGMWIPFSDNMWACSNCRVMGSPQWKRCPVCEAKMDGGLPHNVGQTTGGAEE